MPRLERLWSSYGMACVLAALCLVFTWATWRPESPGGFAGGESLARALQEEVRAGAVLVVAPDDADGRAFVEAFARAAARVGAPPVESVVGDPPTVRAAVEALAARGAAPRMVAATQAARDWAVWDALRAGVPALAGLEVRAPAPVWRSAFLSPGNLRNVADQTAVIAIIAVGMTMVIITGGIDLAVGSLLALSAVTVAWLIRAAGGEGAGAPAMLIASIAACGLTGLVGAFSGSMITRFTVPPFIATLAMMLVASGLAFIVAQGQTIYDIPSSFTWLGRGADLGGVPNAVALMIVLYLAAHALMTRTAIGRRIYAVGGNPEAARLSGISVARTLLFVYLVSGIMAGVGGVITASQLKAGSPTYGLMLELYVIAAVVVGGTSLRGGEGRVFGTLIGAFVIAVIRNGMNLLGVEAYAQKVVLGMVILGAVLLDSRRRRRA
ncbi:MAG TPA: ribose ABC transporter permease [Chthonomonadales bacterium]|nr:ribose ABC transporter permease [Chthonomonadales bacterium]